MANFFDLNQEKKLTLRGQLAGDFVRKISQAKTDAIRKNIFCVCFPIYYFFLIFFPVHSKKLYF